MMEPEEFMAYAVIVILLAVAAAAIAGRMM